MRVLCETQTSDGNDGDKAFAEAELQASANVSDVIKNFPLLFCTYLWGAFYVLCVP